MSFELVCDGLLFDMDGTLLDSTAAMTRIWGEWAIRQGYEPKAFLPLIHGKRAEDTIRALGRPDLDPVAEALFIEHREIEDVEGVVALSGVHAFLDSLPPERWTIVTSAPINLARARLKAAGIPMPSTIIAGEDVKRGKPDPLCFTLGARKLGLAAQACVAFEDSPAGIASAAASGATVVVITATHHAPMDVSHHAVEHYATASSSINGDNKLVLQF